MVAGVVTLCRGFSASGLVVGATAVGKGSGSAGLGVGVTVLCRNFSASGLGVGATAVGSGSGSGGVGVGATVIFWGLGCSF
ncbi:MAG: hypothetical protein HC862_12630 [Scytonema sp. RU_4_4]|nr:hypothetical protein [Scytonema sp. RU_4_4]